MKTVKLVLSVGVATVAAYQPTFRAEPAATEGFSRSRPSDSGPRHYRRRQSNACGWNNPRNRISFPNRRNLDHRRVAEGIGGLQMGGYFYPESNPNSSLVEEIGGRMIDRSKTHMIFGVRCIETKHEVSATTTSESGTTVVGLQPLHDLEDDSSDGTICTDDVEEGKTLSIVLDHLLSELQQGSSENEAIEIVPSDGGDGGGGDRQHGEVFELVEVGADPIVSLAVAKLLSGEGADNATTKSNANIRRSHTTVVVRHPDEQRLRVLEHAHLFFNEKKKNECSFRTEPLKDDEPFVWSPLPPHFENGDYVVLFTSPALVSTRLEEAITGPPDNNVLAYSKKYRVLVPSSIISPEQLKKYEYRVVAGVNEQNETSTDDANNPLLLEILSPSAIYFESAAFQ